MVDMQSKMAMAGSRFCQDKIPLLCFRLFCSRVTSVPLSVSVLCAEGKSLFTTGSVGAKKDGSIRCKSRRNFEARRVYLPSSSPLLRKLAAPSATTTLNRSLPIGCCLAESGSCPDVDAAPVRINAGFGEPASPAACSSSPSTTHSSSMSCSSSRLVTLCPLAARKMSFTPGILSFDLTCCRNSCHKYPSGTGIATFLFGLASFTKTNTRREASMSDFVMWEAEYPGGFLGVRCIYSLRHWLASPSVIVA
mmetsp:Transcript_12711/g.34647  ORF Transcript_12711/g.34647 Transcript_12711/m.34647 type:complete len:250 (-) Transcript_12711:42-791(-)